MFCRSMTTVFLLGALLVVSALFGQTTSTITGTVTDKSGAVVSAAAVRVTNVETDVTREATTDADGTFSVPLLPPGRYRVQVQKEGFRPIVRDNLTLEVNQVARLDFALELGAVTESVQVTSAAPLIESDTSAIGQVIENKQITELPLNGRNFVQLATLGPGVTGVGFSAAGTIMSGTRPDDSRPGSELFSNGNREGSNNFLYDGIDNNERLTLSITLRPSVEAVREFKIQTNMFAAEQGRNAGATVNVISKSGTNQFHGSLYEFVRNDKFDARDFFAPTGQAKPAYRQNQFGASLGGPVVKNKLFFFTNYEGFTKRRENVSVNTVPTEAMRRGDFSAVRDIYDPFTVRPDPNNAGRFIRDAFPNRQIPAARFDPIAVKLINAYPLPQRPGLVNNHTSILKEKQRWDQGDGRIDWNLSEKDMIFGRYSRQDTATTKPSTFQNITLPGLDQPVGLGNEGTFAGDSVLVAHHAVLSWTRTLTPTFLMDAKMGFNRFNLDYRQEGAVEGARLGEKLGVPNANQGPQANGIPITGMSGYQGIGQTRSLPILRVENTYNPNVNFTNLRGRHTFKYGLDVRRRQLSQFQTNRGSGRFNFDATFTTNPSATANTGDTMASFLLGTPALIEQDFLLVFPGIRGTEWGTFVQDDWRVSDRLTLNLGLRYEYDTPYSEVANRWTNFDVNAGKLLIAGFNTDSNVGVNPDRNNWAPRFGFAYKATGSTVVRGGFGIYYNTQGSESVSLRLHRQTPFGPILTETIDQFSNNPRRMSQGFRPLPPLDFQSATANPTGAFLALDPNFKNGTVMQFNLQIQQELPWNMVAKIGYVGNLGRQLDYTYNYNQPDPGPTATATRRPLRNLVPNVTDVTYMTSDGRSAYHALQATAEKRFSSGLSFLTAYTWAHSVDNVPNAFGGAANGPFPQDIRFRNNDRGNSGFDIRHRLTHSMNYELPFGKGKRFGIENGFANAVLGDWQTNVIFTAQTGLPFTPTLNTSVSNAGGSRPDRLKSGEIDNPTVNKWFDTSFNTADAAWGVPRQYTYGNSGRNILYGPGRVNLDFSIFKNFRFSESRNLQFRAESFNLTNTPQFGLPNSAVGNAGAGIITSTVGNPRQMQFALRFAF
jgi:hypothetical protein